MTEISEVFILNPILKKYEKRYILGTDENAAKLFMELCTRRIYIDGFVDDQNAGITFFHRPVYTFQTFMHFNENNILLTNNSQKENWINCPEIFILNPRLSVKKVIICGMNHVGESISSILQKNGIVVEGFIDMGETNGCRELDYPKIYEKKHLTEITEDTAIIVAGESFCEFASIIQSLNKRVCIFYIYQLPCDLNDIWVDWQRGYRITPGAIAQMGEYYSHEGIKEIVLYGNDIKLAKQFAIVYKCLGFECISLMSDAIVKEENVFDVNEIIYKQDYLILVYEEEGQKYFQRLYELGVDKRYYGKAYPWCSPNFSIRDMVLDVNLGNTYRMNSEYPGIYIYGENQKNDFKIAVLGASTTDSKLDPKIRSWVEIMYDQYCQAGITIYNGAVGGYYSGQELIKLVRDMMQLSPDMIIVYDGCSDMIQGIFNKKFKYLSDLVSFAGERIAPYGSAVHVDHKIWMGISRNNETIENWLQNINYMYAIANSKHIKFFSFIEPMLFTKKNLDLHSKSIWKTMMFHVHNDKIIKLAHQYREKAADFEKEYSYIYNLTGIFDDEDVYMDIEHVYENGNEIIAAHIWNVIKDTINLV